MGNVAQKLNQLTPDLRRKAEGYIDALLEEQRFLAALKEAEELSRVGNRISDHEFKQRLEERFGYTGD